MVVTVLTEQFSAAKALKKHPSTDRSGPLSGETVYVDFENNHHVAALAGEHDAHLLILEKIFGVRIDPRGNRLAVTGPDSGRASAVAALKSAYAQLEEGQSVGVEDIRAAANMASPKAALTQDRAKLAIKTPKRMILPRTENQ
ncbi:MAG: hypothetical protein AAFY13_06095, partial [Pseudomonadota bacterium]